jgi:hypothetical protein
MMISVNPYETVYRIRAKRAYVDNNNGNVQAEQSRMVDWIISADRKKPAPEITLHINKHD